MQTVQTAVNSCV